MPVIAEAGKVSLMGMWRGEWGRTQHFGDRDADADGWGHAGDDERVYAE